VPIKIDLGSGFQKTAGGTRVYMKGGSSSEICFVSPISNDDAS
jgi:hypothetical protein